MTIEQMRERKQELGYKGKHEEKKGKGNIRWKITVHCRRSSGWN